MVVLITGITGLVGSAVAKEFLLGGFQVKALLRSFASVPFVNSISEEIKCVEGDVLDVFSLEEAMMGVDYVVHAAAMISFAPRDRVEMQKVNIEGTANIVNACLLGNIKKLCFVSSIAALGRPGHAVIEKMGEIVIDENQKWEDSELNSTYAVTKYQSECEVWRGQAEGLSTVIVNPSVILGEGDWHKSSSQLFKYVFDEKPFYTPGYLNYVDVEDVAKCILELIKSDIENERFCLSGGLIYYKDFFSAIAERFKVAEPKIEVKPWLMVLVWRFEVVKSWFTKKAPLITKETAETSQLRISYNSYRIRKKINFEFRGLNETLDRVCGYMLSTQKS